MRKTLMSIGGAAALLALAGCGANDAEPAAEATASLAPDAMEGMTGGPAPDPVGMEQTIPVMPPEAAAPGSATMRGPGTGVPEGGATP